MYIFINNGKDHTKLYSLKSVIIYEYICTTFKIDGDQAILNKNNGYQTILYSLIIVIFMYIYNNTYKNDGDQTIFYNC